LVRRGMTEAMVDAAVGDLDQADLPSRTIAALRLADRLTEHHPSVDDDLMTILRSEFDDDEILELGVALAVASGWQQFIEAFGIRPDRWNEGTALPW
jgi:alkylhydroperoxidase family enzyme